ncbi:MAG: NAD-dependent epimerase [Betaproteobacteria bacterium]|nr:NAD-dependent epimerase [Betaproteobacteria bacterium]
MKILVTGAAGFIGMHVARRLLQAGHEVVGFDNLNAYYDVGLKQARLQQLEGYSGFRFERGDIGDGRALAALFSAAGITHVVHLAAQAGVRHSLQHPQSYIDSNLNGFAQVLECCRHHAVTHLVYASSSSVYGSNAHQPFSEHHPADHPLSLYAATKRANELMAHAYSHLFGLPVTGLRFFTVYGPWGRPDMAYFSFTRAILEGRPITLFNQGQMRRDFTYVDDIVEGVVRILEKPATPRPDFDVQNPDPATSHAPWRIYNIGHHQPVPLEQFVATLERCLGKKAVREYLPMQPGDVAETHADTADLAEAVGYVPGTPLEEGIERFVQWYRGYYA